MHPTSLKRPRLRLVVAALCGLAAGFLAPGDVATRVLIGWDTLAAVWLVSAAYAVFTVSTSELKRIASQEDEGTTISFAVMIGAVAASLAGVVIEIGAAETSVHKALFTAVGIATLVLSWLFMHTLFALHYAHRFYGDRTGDALPDGGFAFPTDGGIEATPCYFDFVYIAFCIGMTCQVSDVVVLTRDFRRLVTTQAVLAFFYNMFILGLAVNLFASLRG